MELLAPTRRSIFWRVCCRRHNLGFSGLLLLLVVVVGGNAGPSDHKQQQQEEHNEATMPREKVKNRVLVSLSGVEEVKQSKESDGDELKEHDGDVWIALVKNEPILRVVSSR